MPKRNIKNIFIGVALMGFALAIGISAFYILEVKPELMRRKNTVPVHLGRTNDNFMEVTKEENSLQGFSVNLKSLVQEAEKIYPEEEKSKKEGYLWIDEKTSKMVITLGALNGLRAGDQVDVYDDLQKVGVVIVDVALDVISYAYPENAAMKLSKKGQYRVVIE